MYFTFVVPQTNGQIDYFGQKRVKLLGNGQQKVFHALKNAQNK